MEERGWEMPRMMAGSPGNCSQGPRQENIMVGLRQHRKTKARGVLVGTSNASRGVRPKCAFSGSLVCPPLRMRGVVVSPIVVSIATLCPFPFQISSQCIEEDPGIGASSWRKPIPSFQNEESDEEFMPFFPEECREWDL